jgi:hypothetical protein
VRALEITIQEIARIVSEVGEAPSSAVRQQDAADGAGSMERRR